MFGAIATGVGSLLGGMFAGQGAQKGGKMSAKATLKANRQNLKYQMLFAKKGLRWKINDARKAGVAPLAALGAQSVSFSPSFVGATQAGQGVADSAAAMGQGISRAATALGSADDQNSEYLRRLQQLQLDNMTLQNQALGSQIRLMSQPGTPLAAPVAAERYLIPGQGAGVDVVPHRVNAGDPSRVGFDAGTINDVQAVAATDGSQVIVPADAVKQAVEDVMVPSVQMQIRHNLDIAAEPRKFWKGPIGPDEDVVYNVFTGRLTKFKVSNYGKTKDWP